MDENSHLTWCLDPEMEQLLALSLSLEDWRISIGGTSSSTEGLGVTMVMISHLTSLGGNRPLVRDLNSLSSILGKA